MLICCWNADVHISLSHPSKLFNLSLLSVFVVCFTSFESVGGSDMVWMCQTEALTLTPFCSYRKRASPLPKDDHSGGVKDCLLANSSDPVEMRRLNYQTPGTTPYTICTVDTHYQPARAPCVLHHMYTYTLPLTQSLIFELITICTNTISASSLHTQCMHIIHCTIYHLCLVQYPWYYFFSTQTCVSICHRTCHLA